MTKQTATATPTAAPYLTTYSEEQWLDVFYLAVRNGNDRIGMLRKLAGVQLMRPSEWDTYSIRASVWGVTFNLRAEQCFACFTGSRFLYWHHIIQVQHGGSNGSRNFVRLCHRCHRDVHPWLEAPTTRETKTPWVAFQDLARLMMGKVADVVRRHPTGETSE